MADITIAASGNAPAIAAFRNIQFVAAFTDGSSSTINALPLSAGGAAAGGTFRVNAPTDVNPTRQWPAIAEFFGGFVIAWIERGPNLGPNVKLRVFDGDTFAPGDEIQVNTTPVDSNQPPALARLSDGGFVLVWADARPEERIRAQRFDRLGNRNSADFRANTVAGLHRRPMVAVLANGSIVIGWLARVTGPLQVRFQIFDASATPVGGERLLDGGASLASVTALDSGRFVIAHLRHPADGETLPQVIAEVNVFSRPVLRPAAQFPSRTSRRSCPPGRRSRRCRAAVSSWRGRKGLCPPATPSRTSTRRFSPTHKVRSVK